MTIGREAGERRFRQLRPAPEQSLGARTLQPDLGVLARRGSGNARLPLSGNERPKIGTAHARWEVQPEGVRYHTTSMTYDVLIVGFGPVGATMANLLARRGLHVGVVEAEREIHDKPRAITHDHEVMRIYQACGLVQRIAQFTAPHPGTHYLGVDGRVIKKVESLPPPYPLAWPPTGTFVQPEVERLLRQGVAGCAAVEVFLGHRGIDFTQDDDGVALTVRDGPALAGDLIRARQATSPDISPGAPAAHA